MISSLLLLHSCAQVAWTCMPMDPGEELVCPSAPIISKDISIPGFINYVVPEENDGVYTCPANKLFPISLISFDGTVGKDYAVQSSLLCRPNSGQFVVNDGSRDMVVSNKKFTCGFDCSSCKANDPKVLEVNDPSCKRTTDTLQCTAKPVVRKDYKGNNNGCSILTCAKDYMVSMKKDMKYEEDVGDLFCAAKKWLILGEINSPVDEIGFVCARECISCKSKLLPLIKEGDALCNARQDKLECTGKPMLDMEDDCSVWKCPPKSSIVSIFNNKKYAASLYCKFGEWVSHDPSIGNSMGIACAKGCDSCPMPNLLEPIACANHAELKCTSKPTVGTNSNACSFIQCAAGETLYALDDVFFNIVDFAECTTEKWTIYPSGDLGYVCATRY